MCCVLQLWADNLQYYSYSGKNGVVFVSPIPLSVLVHIQLLHYCIYYRAVRLTISRGDAAVEFHPKSIGRHGMGASYDCAVPTYD